MIWWIGMGQNLDEFIIIFCIFLIFLRWEIVYYTTYKMADCGEWCFRFAVNTGTMDI
jgi:hypothetical protein